MVNVPSPLGKTTFVFAVANIIISNLKELRAVRLNLPVCVNVNVVPSLVIEFVVDNNELSAFQVQLFPSASGTNL